MKLGRPSLLSAILLSACSLNPKYERPEAPIPSSFTGAASPEGKDSKELLEDWRKHFTDPELQKLIDLSLGHNRDLKLAVLRLEETRAAYGIQRADRLPNFAGTGTFFRGKQIDPISGQGVTGTQIEASVGLVAYELDFFGRVRSLSEAALAQYYATDEARRSAQISLIAATASGYVRELAFAQQEQLAMDTLRSREDSLKIDQRRLEAGVANALELKTTETLVHASRARLAEVRRGREQNRNALRVLVGDFSLTPKAEGTKVESLTFPELTPDLSSNLLERRPDIRQAEQQLLAANANIGAARAAFFPSISLTSSIGSVSDEFSDLFKNGTEVWSFVPQINIPIFSGGRNKARLDIAEVRKEMAIVTYEQTIQNAFREVRDALVARDQLRVQLDAQGAVRDAESERARLTQKRYERGVSNYLEYLDAQRSQFASEQDYLALQELRLANDIELYKALGGGW